MQRWIAGIGALVLGLLASGCKPPELEAWRPPEKKDYNRPLKPGELALRKIDPKDYPDFSRGFYARARLEEAIRNSLAYLAKPSSQRYFPYGEITHTQAVQSLQTFLEVLRTARDPKDLDAQIRQRFEVWRSVGYDGKGTVFFTGYYCPIFEGRKTPDARFKYPLYATPSDLVKDEEGRTLGRRSGGGTVPYYTRREIEERGLLRGSEIAWLKDPFEAYVVTVQGSAKLRLADGSIYELGYGANNGHPYTSVGYRLIEAGQLKADELSLQGMMRYFARNPNRVYEFTWVNDRYVFFQERPGGPFGSINVPVLPYRSIATDKEVFPRACLAFLDTQIPRVLGSQVSRVPYAGFACDQDTGGAIRAAGRCDIFMGIGPDAESIAGRTGAEGMLYYLFVPTGRTARAAPAPEGPASPIK